MAQTGACYESRQIKVTVNGVTYERDVDVRLLLSDFIRQEIGLTGTHVGCEEGVCGACSVILDGKLVRSCLMFAVQADGCQITTVEGIAQAPDNLHPIQEALIENHGVQCGFCTPGVVVSMYSFLRENPQPKEEEIREALAGNICRCTGYAGIVGAVKSASRKVR